MKAVKWIAGILVGGFVLMMVIGTMHNNTPEGRATSDGRMAISLCWQEQGKKSLPPDQARFIAGACEKMERDFREKYNATP